MSTPENPESGQLTRRQMRQLSTAATPIVGSDTAVATQEAPTTPAPRPHLPRPSSGVVVSPAPVPDAAVDLGVQPLTRRQARQQERIRTASVPVITPEAAALHSAGIAPSALVPEPEAVLWTPEVADERDAAAETDTAPTEESTASEVHTAESDVEANSGADAAHPDADVAAHPASADPDAANVDASVDTPIEPDVEAPATAEVVVDEGAPSDGEADTEPDADADADADAILTVVDDPAPESGSSSTGGHEASVEAERSAAVDADEPAADDVWLDVSDAGADPESVPAAPRVDARLGENLLAVADPADVEAVSFDELITRDSGSGGSVSAPHALILSHVPEASPLSAVTSTGEVIVTGIYNLPDGLGSQGHALGAADGKEVDATFMDGELPAHSSPTPIAASAAISTVRGTGEIIRPPAPEKSGRLVMVLAISAAVALVAAVTLLIVALQVFN